MNININTTVTSQSENSTRSRETGLQNNSTAASRDNGKAATTDTVTLSESARLINSGTGAASTYPAPDNQRIVELKNEITAGTFNIDPARIAEKLHQFNMILQ